MHITNRLRNSKDFQKVYRRGKSIANRQLILYQYKRLDTDPLRLGISVSKKVGSAVIRNRIRRLLKEIVRHHLDDLPGGIDLVIIARLGVGNLDYDTLQKSVIHLLRKAHLFKK